MLCTSVSCVASPDVVLCRDICATTRGTLAHQSLPNISQICFLFICAVEEDLQSRKQKEQGNQEIGSKVQFHVCVYTSSSSCSWTSKMLLLLLLPLLATAAPSPTSSSSSSSSGGSSLAGLAASGVAGVVLGMALAPQPDCEDVGVRSKNHN